MQLRRPSIAAFLFLSAIAANTSAQTLHRAKVPITVGPNVQVSKAFADFAHYEHLTAADPDHPGRITSCVMVFPRVAGKICYQNCYSSFDGGSAWEPTLKVWDGWVNGDPSVAYGHGDTVYAVSLERQSIDRDHEWTVVFKSNDGGHTWAESSRFPFMDRDYITVDRTGGKYDGRVYIMGQEGVYGTDGNANSRALHIYRSPDGAKTFLGPVYVEMPPGGSAAPYGGVVLSDGTYVMLYRVARPHPGREGIPSDNLLQAISSRDGGENFGQAVTIANSGFDWNQLIAVDPGSSVFKDRIYAVFTSKVSHRDQVLLSYSADNGQTWSKPAIVNDDRSPTEDGKGPDHLLPAVAVNKEGVVLVVWYDRREAKDKIGWRLRAASSLDGGETFSASVPVAEVFNAYTDSTPWDMEANDLSGPTSPRHIDLQLNSFFTGLGPTSGLAATADGTFVPTWFDNRTGVPQIWSASVKVTGAPVKHGSTDLSNLDDVSKSVEFAFSGQTIDRRAGTVRVTAELKNVSQHAIKSPLKVRILSLESQLGIPQITNADNSQAGSGAVWDFTAQLPNGSLAPNELSSSRVLIFHLSDIRPLQLEASYVPGGLVSFDALILGKADSERTK
jgi:hypothetical protein